MARAALCKIYKMALLALALVLQDANAANKHLRKKFENPATKFEGIWQVIDYDFREFEERPINLEKQLKEEAGDLPVVQEIGFKHTGAVIMLGSINLH